MLNIHGVVCQALACIKEESLGETGRQGFSELKKSPLFQSLTLPSIIEPLYLVAPGGEDPCLGQSRAHPASDPWEWGLVGTSDNPGLEPN